MPRPSPSAVKPLDARAKLLDAAVGVIRTKGYAGTSVDDLCAVAGVTKGAFFHHFKSKEALAVAAADHWSGMTGAVFASAPYHDLPDPLDRVLGYIAFRGQLLNGPVEAFTCLVGTLAQEVFVTHPEIRDACNVSITGHAAALEADIAAALVQYGVEGVTATSLALHTQAVLQGGFILAKAQSGPQAAVESVEHLTRYFKLLFQRKSN